jgi:hypothetical protein
MDGSAASSSDGGLARRTLGSPRFVSWSLSERKTLYLFAVWLFASLCFAAVYVCASWREFWTLADQFGRPGASVRRHRPPVPRG